MTQPESQSFQSVGRRKRRVVKEGDTLWLIAAIEYGNPALWRRIALKNKIYNPRLLEPGRNLVIPPVE